MSSVFKGAKAKVSKVSLNDAPVSQSVICVRQGEQLWNNPSRYGHREEAHPRDVQVSGL